MAPFEVPPFITAENRFADEYSARKLARQVASGALVRVRRGLYLPTDVWNTLRPWEQYRVRIEAVHLLAKNRPVFAHESAAQILGLPLITIPRDVHTVVSGGRSGGQSSNGIRRTLQLPDDPPPWEVQGILVTPPPQTVRDLALRLPLTHSLPAIDRLMQATALPSLSRHGSPIFTQDHVRAAAAMLPYAAQRRRVGRVVDVSVDTSQSAGESFSRAIMLQNGFPAPELQTAMLDRAGFIGYTDFCWESHKLIGEFDGHEKYSAQQYLKGMTPSDTVIREKNRENRLRALGYTVVRWEWQDLKHPERLIHLLQDAGLPRR